MSESLFREPFETTQLVGHEAAQQQLLDAWVGDRLHHAWMIGGAKGVGKATLAYRFVRFLVAQDGVQAADGGLFGDELASSTPTSMDVDLENAAVRMVLQSQHQDVKIIEPTHLAEDGKERAACELRVYQIRRLYEWLSQTASGGGRRIVVIDALDGMNSNAANALLKLLEEPPADTLFLLISHAPGRVLPTIRSRCRQLLLAPLAAGQVRAVLDASAAEMFDPVAMRLAVRMSAGSPGMAATLYEADVFGLHEKIMHVFSQGELDILRLQALANAVSGKGKEADWAMVVYVFREMLGAAIKQGATGVCGEIEPEEQALYTHWLAHSSLDALLDAWENSGQIVAQVGGIHMDKNAALVEMIGELRA